MGTRRSSATVTSPPQEVEPVVLDEIIPVLLAAQSTNMPLPMPTSRTPLRGSSSSRLPASQILRALSAAIRGLHSLIRKFRLYFSGRRSSGSHSRGIASPGSKRPSPTGESPRSPPQHVSPAFSVRPPRSPSVVSPIHVSQTPSLQLPVPISTPVPEVKVATSIPLASVA